MGLKCRISYREGEVVVRKENGELSDLYYELLDYAKSPSIALDMWATAHSREMGEIGEDATVDEVVKYFDSAVAAKESLSPSEKMQVKDFMRRNGVETLDQLNKTLAESFKPNGVFEINPVAAVNSGLFTQDELVELDPLALQNLLLKIEGHLINDNFTVEPESQSDFYKDTTSKTIFGTYDRVSQEEVDAAIRSKIETFDNIEDFYEKIKELPYEDFVTRFTEDDKFANTIINRFSNLKRIPKLSIINGRLSKDNNKTYTTVKNTVSAGQNTTKVEADIDYLNSIDTEVWDSNPELIRQVLKEVEQEFIDLNVDVVGISEFPGRRAEVMAVIESATQMLNSVTEENIRTFSDNLSNLLSVQDTVVVENIPSEYTGYNIVSLHTEIPENELFNTYGLIKVGDNLFHKVDQRANAVDLIDFIYGEILNKRLSIPAEYMLTKDILDKPSVLNDISRYLMSRSTIQGLQDKELYSAYQVLFNHRPLASKVNEARELAVIKTDENYLKTSFVSDFYNYILKEKAANTSTYKTILSKFEITDRDITLTDTIPSIVGIEFQQELSDYIRLQKDSNMKYLVEPTTEIVSEDLLYTNFPEAKSEYEGDFVMLGDYIITPTTSDNFIKVNGELYRRGLDRENGRLFVKVPQRSDSKYYTKNLNFEFDRAEASSIFDKYNTIKKDSVDYTTFKSIISKSRIEDDMNVNLKEFSTLKDKSYTFFQVNNAIVAFKDGVRVGSIRYTKTADGYATPELTVSEIHRGKGIATELYLKMFDKILKEGKVFYPSEVRTPAAQNIFSRLERLLIPTPSGGFMVSDSISTTTFPVDSPYSFEASGTQVDFNQPTNTVKETQIVPREAFEIVATRLSENGLLKGNLIVNKQGFYDGLRIANKENRSNAAPNEVAGFVLGEDIFINPSFLNYNTPIHEYGHLWAKWARDFRPDLYNRGIELVSGSEYYNDIVNRSKDKDSVYFNYTEDKILEEALVTAIGNQGESFVNKTKLESFKQFLSDLWASIKNALGLTQMSPEQVSNLTLDQFAEAVAIDLLKGDTFKTSPYTITALLDPMLANREGKMVNVQTIKQVLNQPSTKKIEKDILNEILDLEYFKGRDKIPFNYFKAEVNKRLMPLDVVISDTYATYGSGNVGTLAQVFETHIYNTSLDHLVEGHFRPDFSKTDNVEFEIREIGRNFFVVEAGAILTNENITEKVYNSASTRERAQAWIDNYDNVRSLNKGMFGHTRMWYDNTNKIVYAAEFQSDSYQKAKATDMLLTAYTRDESKLTEAQKPIWEKLKELRTITDKARRNVDEFTNVKDLSEDIKDTLDTVKRLDSEIETTSKELSSSPDSNVLAEILDRKKRSKDINKGMLDQLIKLAKGEEVTLPEEVRWTENDPGGSTGQQSVTFLPYDRISRFVKNTRSYKIKNGKEEYTLYHQRKGGNFFEKDRYAFEEKSRDTDLQNFIELVDNTSRNVTLGETNLSNEPLLEDLVNKIGSKKPIKISDILDVLEQVVPNISKSGTVQTFSRRTELSLQKTLLADRGRSEKNLTEITRQIQRLFEAQLNVRNNREYDAYEEQIQSLRDKANRAGLLSEEDQAEYDKIEKELDSLDREYKLFFENEIVGVFGISDKVSKNGISELRKALPLKATIEFNVEPLESFELSSASGEMFFSKEEAFDIYKLTTLENPKVNPDAYLKYFNALKEIPKLEEKLINEASLNEKQFVAHRKNYTERLLREEIRRNAEMGMEELRIPTPRTLALIEGYIDTTGSAPYEIITGDSDYLQQGDQIEYLGKTHYVVDSDSGSIEVVSSDYVSWVNIDEYRSDDIYSRVSDAMYEVSQDIDYGKIYTFEEIAEKDIYELKNLDLSKFNRYQTTYDSSYDSWTVVDKSDNSIVDTFDTEQEAISLKDSIDENTYVFQESIVENLLYDYYEDITETGKSYAEDMGYTVFAEDNYYLLMSTDYSPSTESLKQPSEYAADVDAFSMEDVTEEEQTILRKYEGLIDLFKKERPDATIKLDSEGNEWLSTRLTEQDFSKPVVVFMEVSERRAPSKDIENVSSIFDSRLELLDLYSSKEEASIIKDINDCGA